jgi:hypothetical protein
MGIRSVALGHRRNAEVYGVMVHDQSARRLDLAQRFDRRDADRFLRFDECGLLDRRAQQIDPDCIPWQVFRHAAPDETSGLLEDRQHPKAPLPGRSMPSRLTLDARWSQRPSRSLTTM